MGLTRRDVFRLVTTSATVFTGNHCIKQPAQAFDADDRDFLSNFGSLTVSDAGASLARKKAYKERVIADVKDFRALGVAIDKGETDGNGWVNFFIRLKRREPDSAGRAYAGLTDLVGTATDGGGCGVLFAATFAKPGKPPENVPAFKKFNDLAKTFDPIEKAGKSGDLAKAKAAYAKSSGAFSQFLEAADLPGSLADPLYN